MSQAVYPTLPGLEFNCTRTPKWSTTRKTAVSLREYRSANASYPVYHYKLSYEFLRNTASFPELATLAGFFNARNGSFDSFLFTDPDDNTANLQLIGTGDGANKLFQLVRTFGAYVEPVFDPNSAPLIYVGGQPANLLMNSSFESQTAGLPWGYVVYNNAGIPVTLTAPAGRTGGLAYGLKANAIGATQFGLSTGAANLMSGVTGGVRAGGWQPNQTYTVSFYARKLAGASWTNIGLGWNVSPTSIVYVTNPNLTTAWQRYEIQLMWGGSVETLGSLYISIQGATAINDELQIDDLHVMMSTGTAAYVGNQSYTIGLSGLLTFDVAPGTALAVLWTGSYYRRVTFAADAAEFTKFMSQLWNLKTLELVSVKP